MTKNPNSGLFILSLFIYLFILFFFFFGGGGGGGGAGLGRARGGVGKDVGAFIFISDPLYQPNTHYFTFS